MEFPQFFALFLNITECLHFTPKMFTHGDFEDRKTHFHLNPLDIDLK